jgi:hypothetical protein
MFSAPIESALGSIMGVAYSQDLRDRVMAAVDGGLGVYSAAPMFRVSVSYIYKALGRRRATVDALIRAIASALETFTPHECANYLANSGYRRQS